MPKNILGERLKSALAKQRITATELARRANIRTSFLYDIINGKSKNPSTVTLSKVAELLEVPLSYLAGSDAAHYQQDEVARPGIGYVAVPRLDVQVSAGGGTIVSHENPEEFYYFRRQWIRDKLSATPADLRLLFVRGDSMEPTLNDGDMVLVDTAQKMPSPPGIFVLFDGMGLVVKRLEIAGNLKPPMIRILSDNPQYSPYEKLVDETRIVGKVVWFAREL